jgi:hypothetical protein
VRVLGAYCAAPSDASVAGLQVLNARAGGKPKEEGGEEEEEEEEDFFGEPNTHLGENMTALAIPGRVLEAPKGTQQLPLPKERVSVILNFGIIDILQEYNISKQIEHNWKVRTPARRRGACAGLAAALTLPPAVPVSGATPKQHLLGGPARLCGALQGVHERRVQLTGLQLNIFGGSIPAPCAPHLPARPAHQLQTHAELWPRCGDARRAHRPSHRHDAHTHASSHAQHPSALRTTQAHRGRVSTTSPRCT